MLNLVSRLIGDERGVTAIEYSLIGALISVAAVSFIATIGTNLSDTFNTIANNTPALTFQRPFLDRGTTGNVDVTGLSVDLRNAYAQQWNLTIERDLGLSTGLRLSYVGTRSTALVYGRNVNQPVPSAQPFNQRGNGSRSHHLIETRKK